MVRTLGARNVAIGVAAVCVLSHIIVCLPVAVVVALISIGVRKLWEER